jgi:hypothetical protein
MYKSLGNGWSISTFGASVEEEIRGSLCFERLGSIRSEPTRDDDVLKIAVFRDEMPAAL